MLFLLFPPNYRDRAWHLVYSAGRKADSVVTQCTDLLEQLRAWLTRTQKNRVEYVALRRVQRRATRYKRKIRIRQRVPNLVAALPFAAGWAWGFTVKTAKWLRDAAKVGYQEGEQ